MERRNFRGEKFDYWQSGDLTISNFSHNREQWTITNLKTQKFTILNTGKTHMLRQYPQTD
jgi:hypothetical protein